MKSNFHDFRTLCIFKNRCLLTTNQNRQWTKRCWFFSSIFISKTMNANWLIHSQKKKFRFRLSLIMIQCDDENYDDFKSHFFLHMNHKENENKYALWNWFNRSYDIFENIKCDENCFCYVASWFGSVWFNTKIKSNDLSWEMPKNQINKIDSIWFETLKSQLRDK